MSTSADLLEDAFGRISEGVELVLDELTPQQLAHRITPDANTIAWLVWHLLRVQDDHVSDAAGTDQVWTSAGWHKRLGLPFDASDTGYGHSRDEVGAVTTTPELLVGYARAVTAATQAYVTSLSDDDLDRVVDESWDPPVTLGVRLVSVIEDDLKHLGQAEYVKGLL
ncbi:DUF664 domain-containing protein [Aeromicrobium sp. SMF47]|uniref:mycothiol transferase n=1 Tax=Aeromicrobium yanjiei TaxID=2662028 RepID=UPI00129EA7D9|nr:DUF664 domain-containing protein [Aeromicrobium yanjiei]MRJ75613.1 DUF664 domain-containing protein [Aeromicrobium yanjiei]